MKDQWTAVDAYLDAMLVREDEALVAALRDSQAAGLPAIAVTPSQGKLLHLLALMVGARRILEVGTLGGYSAIWMARSLPPDGKLLTLEIEPKHADVAQKNFVRAGVADRIEIRRGAALELLPRIAADRLGPFDLAFIDADKQSNPEYFEWALELSRRGSLIVIDNVVRDGTVLEEASRDPGVLGVRRLMERMAREPRVSTTAIQTVGAKGWDGLALALVTAGA
jgi:predicted O-methyltransferase YrrM